MANLIGKIQLGWEIEGEVRFLRYDDEERTQLSYDSGWIKNLMTNLGLTNAVDAANWGNRWCVSDNGAAPQFTDTAMGGAVSVLNGSTGVPAVYTVGGAPNYMRSNTDSRQWPAGPGNSGTIRRFGLCKNTDGTQAGVLIQVSPEITKSETQVVDIYYRMNLYPAMADLTPQIDISGVTYNTIVRPARIASGANAQLINGQFYEAGSGHLAYSGNINANVESNPSGASDGPTTINKISSGVGIRQYNLIWGTNDGNIGDIRSVFTLPSFTGIGGFGIQVQFNNFDDGTAIPKTSNDTLTLNFQMTLSRR